MSLNLGHAARAIARFNYICGTQIFRKDGRVVWVVTEEAGDATVTRLDKGKLRINLSIEGSTWIRDGKDIPTEENDAEIEGRDLIARIRLWRKTAPFTSGELAAKLLAEGRSKEEGCSSLDTDILSSAPDGLISSAISGRLTPWAVSGWLRE